MSFAAIYPPVTGQGSAVPTYGTLADFPSAVSAGDGALAIALDTHILYESNGVSWVVLANPAYAAAITSLTGDVTATGPGAAAATVAAIQTKTVSGTTGTTNVVFSNSPTLVTPALGTPSALVLTNATGLPLTTGVTGVLAIANGGTGQSSASAAFNALSPITTTGDLIYSASGATNTRLGIGSAANVLTVSGGVPIWAPPATSGTVTSVAMTVPTFLSVSGSPITSSGTLAVTLSGTALPVLNGGTGVTTSTGTVSVVLSDSPVLVTPNLGTPSTLVGTNISGTATNLTSGITNALKSATTTVNVSSATAPSSGQILTATSNSAATWQSPATSGTVTSVAMTVPSFLSVAGSPVTSTGTLAVTLSGTALPIANGGTGQTTASAAFNALSPITTTGDMIYSASGATNTRIGIGSTNNLMTVVGGVPAWSNLNVAFLATSSGLTITSGAGAVKIPFDTEVFDTNNNFDTSNNRFLPTVAGYYMITFAARINTTVSLTDVVLRGYKNGSEIRTQNFTGLTSTANVSLMVTTIENANGSTDYFEVFVSATGSGTLTLETSSTRTWFTGTFVSK